MYIENKYLGRERGPFILVILGLGFDVLKLFNAFSIQILEVTIKLQRVSPSCLGVRLKTWRKKIHICVVGKSVRFKKRIILKINSHFQKKIQIKRFETITPKGHYFFFLNTNFEVWDLLPLLSLWLNFLLFSNLKWN